MHVQRGRPLLFINAPENEADDILHLYEQYLQSHDDVEDYRRHFIPVVYWDDDGEEKVYYIDYYVRWRDNVVEWVQCVPHKDLKPIKKYLYAKRISEASDIRFRGLSDDEMSSLHKYIRDRSSMGD